MIISVALVLVLMLAVTKIFSITGAAVGASQGLNAATRDARAAQTVFTQDLGALASDSPFIVIRNQIQSAYRNKLDEQSDLDGNPLTLDINGNGVDGESTVPGEIVAPLTINSRNHRQDVFTFCARNRFYRQTGNNGTFVDNMSSPEAWIWYGHLALPDNSGNYKTAGNGSAAANPNNFYASQWTLGRTAALMVTPTANKIYDAASPPVSQTYFAVSTAGTYDLTPLSPETSSSDNAFTIPTARYDLVGTSIADFKQRLADYINPLKTPKASYYGGNNWWEALMTRTPIQANPLVQKPMSSTGSAGLVPLFLPACSQFIVEYAGDFMSQDQFGNPQFTTSVISGKKVPAGPDGQVDFIYDPTTGQKTIQWYGLPRSPAGNAIIAPESGDVVPLGDFFHHIAARIVGTDGKTVTPNSDNQEKFDTVADLNTVGFASFERYTTNRSLADSFDTSVATAFSYYAAWGPDSGTGTNIPRPKMYRITITIDRPEMAGRTQDGQTFEYIINAP